MEGSLLDWTYHAYVFDSLELSTSFQGSTQGSEDLVFYLGDLQHSQSHHPYTHEVEPSSPLEFHHHHGDSHEDYPMGSTSYKVPSTSYDQVDTLPPM